LLDSHCVQRTKLFYALLYDRFDLREIRDVANSTYGIDTCRLDLIYDVVDTLLVGFDVVDA
jgi:hypothetical protein